MRPDIRGQTVLIIQKDGKYYCGRMMVTGWRIWRETPYDARRTRKRDVAARAAETLGGKVMLFNPVAGQVRDVREAYND